MPRELFQSPNLARSFTQLSSPSLTIRKRRADLSPPPWCRLTPAIVRQGLGSTAYEHCIDLYCIEELEVSDTNRRIMTFWKIDTKPAHTCDVNSHLGSWTMRL